MKRLDLMNIITAYVTKHTAVAFHEIKAVNGADVTFSSISGEIEIFIETFSPYTENEVTWEYLSDEALKEICDIIKESINLK